MFSLAFYLFVLEVGNTNSKITHILKTRGFTKNNF